MSTKKDIRSTRNVHTAFWNFIPMLIYIIIIFIIIMSSVTARSALGGHTEEFPEWRSSPLCLQSGRCWGSSGWRAPRRTGPPAGPPPRPGRTAHAATCSAAAGGGCGHRERHSFRPLKEVNWKWVEKIDLLYVKNSVHLPDPLITYAFFERPQTWPLSQIQKWTRQEGVKNTSLFKYEHKELQGRRTNCISVLS